MNRKQIERREQLIYGRSFTFENYSPDGISYFNCVTVDIAKKLMDEGFLDLDRRSFAPSVEEMLDFCFASDDKEIWYFHGFTISHKRLDCRVTFEGMGSLALPTPQRKEAFARLHHNADVLEVKPDMRCYCWYD